MDRWWAQYEMKGEDAFSGNPWRTDVDDKDVEIERLSEEVRSLQAENRALIDVLRQLGIKIGRKPKKP
jgi:hypothetical protein